MLFLSPHPFAPAISSTWKSFPLCSAPLPDFSLPSGFSQFQMSLSSVTFSIKFFLKAVPPYLQQIGVLPSLGSPNIFYELISAVSPLAFKTFVTVPLWSTVCL